MNWLKALIVLIVLGSLVGIFLTGGNAQSAFEQLFIMGAVFIAVVEFVPQFIVGEEKKPGSKTEDP